MSGPTTLEYLILQSALLGAEAALRAARGIGAARDQTIRDASQRAAQSLRMRDEQRAALRHIATRARQLETALERLNSLAALHSRDGAGAAISMPARPSSATEEALSAYTASLEQALNDARARLSGAASRMAQSQAAASGAERVDRVANPRSLNELLDAYLAAGRSARDDARLAERRARIQRLLAPLAAGESVEALPADMGLLLAELAQPGEEQRTQAVELELQRLVTRERTRREAAARAQGRARELLARLDALAGEDAEVEATRQSLELAAAGLLELTVQQEARAHALAEARQASQAEAVRKAAATVLEGTLADLGFVVEPISHTLFMEGGVAHFSRPEWGEYAVRLRTSPTDATLNFNVVREAGGAGTDAASARLRDLRAEQTWCEHIPRLTQALEARGIRLKTRRLLGAGEAPVQVVPAGALSSLTKPAAGARATQPAPATREAP
jgi:hypothetical protein